MSLSAPSTGSALTTRATRRSILPKSSIVQMPATASTSVVPEHSVFEAQAPAFSSVLAALASLLAGSLAGSLAGAAASGSSTSSCLSRSTRPIRCSNLLIGRALVRLVPTLSQLIGSRLRNFSTRSAVAGSTGLRYSVSRRKPSRATEATYCSLSAASGFLASSQGFSRSTYSLMTSASSITRRMARAYSRSS